MNGSLTDIMDELVELEEGFTFDPSVRIYRWRTEDIPELPAIWHWLNPSPFEQRDTARWRDTLNIGIRMAPEQRDMELAEISIDQLRDQLDTYLAQEGNPFGGLVHHAERTGMRQFAEVFNDIEVVAFEFVLTLQVDRILRGVSVT